MSEAIAGAVRELEAQGQALFDLAGRLRDIGGMDKKSPPDLGMLIHQEVLKPKPKLAKEFPAYRIKVGRKSQPATGTRNGPLSPEVLAKGLKIEEPLTWPKLAEAFACNWKRASNMLTQWGLKGYVKRVGLGTYVRTRNFPGASALAPTASTKATTPQPPADDNKTTALAQLQKEIGERLAERDRLRAAGNEDGARQAQDMVRRLDQRLKMLVS